MASEYSRNMIKVSIAKMLQTIGWNSIHSTPLEILTDISTQYIIQLAKTTHDYANEFGCIEPTLDHLGLSLKEHHVNLQELQEYVKYVNFGPTPTPVPKYPVSKENSLNFLKPGSKEVVTRQVHVHEHLPPMCEDEAPKSELSSPIKMENEEQHPNNEPTTPVFKRPAEISPGESFKRPRPSSEEEGRPTREISSVMMTTSGYISPAREGKLPESRTPAGVEAVLANIVTSGSNDNITFPPIQGPSASQQQPLSSPVITSTTNLSPATADGTHKVNKLANKKQQERSEKKKSSKELFKNGAFNHGPSSSNFANESKSTDKVKKPKEPKKQKIIVPSTMDGKADGKADGKGALVTAQHKSPVGNKVNKALAAARLKTEKLNTTITPIVNNANKNEKVDKLLTEPDKKKVNILKKISNVKNEKPEKPQKIKEESRVPSRETSPGLVIDEPNNDNSKLHISNDITIELVESPSKNLEPYDANKVYYDDDSPPGTPSTPKTPEMISHSPPIVREKKKRKDKSKVKKVLKSSPIREHLDHLESSSNNVDIDRPKTPQPHIIPGPQFPLFPFSAGPGLIPGMPLFPMGPMMFGLPPGNNPLIPPLRTGFAGMIPTAINKNVPEESVLSKSPAKDVVEMQSDVEMLSPKSESKKKKDKKDKIKKKNKKDKIKNKAEKKKLKEEKKDKIKVKKERRKDKEKDVEKGKESLEITVPKLTLKLGTPSPRPDTPDTKKLNIKPIIKREPEETREAEMKRELSPELAKISALVTGQPKPKSSPVIPPNTISSESFHLHTKKSMFKPNPSKIRSKEFKADPPVVEVSSTLEPKYTDSEGNVVWICPGCGRQDDGSPMIGCDDCDAWYHWVCVGIQVPPDETENWYCRQCIAKKQENLQPDKKRKRKKREKKDH